MTASAEKRYPFSPGPFPVAARTIEWFDSARSRHFPCEVWYPAAEAALNAAPEPGIYPLVLYSHHSGGNRRSASYLCNHLCSHGYLVAAIDHSETIAPELARRDGETKGEMAARVDAAIASRVPDIRFLLDRVVGGAWDSDAKPDSMRIGIVGHSFGGWTALAAPESEPRISAVAALAPGGASNPRPGIIRAHLTFAWDREVTTLYLVAEGDVPLPLEGMYELFGRTPEPKQMVILRRADHLHFIDNAAQQHETFRALPPTGQEWDWIPSEMRPFSELCSEQEAHAFICALTLAHLDAALKGHEQARQFLAGDIEAGLASQGISAAVYRT